MFKKIKKCRSCNSSLITKVLDLGKQPLANGLLKKKNTKNTISIPLELFICKDCKLLQLSCTVEPQILFKNYLWVTGTSKKVNDYRKYFFDKLKKYLKLEKKFIVEIASNDGFFLEYLKKNNTVLGIDPAKNLAKIAEKKGVKTVSEFFNLSTSKEICKKYKKKPDLVICRNVIPHIENIQEVMKSLNYIISDNGIGVIEFHDASNILENNHYDYIYHEHIFYFTITSLTKILKRYGMYTFDFFKSPISGGSYVILFKKKKVPISKNLQKKIKVEKKNKIDSVQIWKSLEDRCKKHRTKLLEIFNNNIIDNKICGYGASARSSTLLNYLKLENNSLDKIFDINTLKSNLYTPGTNIKVEFPTKNKIQSYSIIFLLAWNFKKEVVNFLKLKGFKGKILQPLPKIKFFKLK